MVKDKVKGKNLPKLVYCKEGAPVGYLHVKMSSDLYQLLAAKSDEDGVPMNEVVVEALAEKLKRPDLSFIPRKKMGRPRRNALVAQPTG